MNHLHEVQTASAKPPGIPLWYNEQGQHMAPKQPNVVHGMLCDLMFGKGVIASLYIKQVGRRPKYTVVWILQHRGGLDPPYTSGRIECSASEVRKMFCLDDSLSTESDFWLIGRYGGTVAAQGKFLRWGRYLNIPGPGTGRNGDPNISVYVSDEIKQAVQSMLEKHAFAKV